MTCWGSGPATAGRARSTGCTCSPSPTIAAIKNRGVADACIVVCDGLKGLPESITTVWPQALVQACVLHLVRNTFRYASRRYWEQMARDLRPVYTAPTEAAAATRFDEFTATWGSQYPAVIALWRSAWSEFVPSLLR